MEVMEDGNLMDRVRILIQRDLEYYKEHQIVLQESICANIVGGKLDFPRNASFAATKLVTWWEQEYLNVFRKASGFIKSSEITEFEMDVEIEVTGGCGGVIKPTGAVDFSANVVETAGCLLTHLHVLTQEALDHADLTVLTNTLGAASLVKNSLWFYCQIYNDKKQLDFDSNHLQKCYKQFSEMTEALAERLLDMHIRLISLYILQDPDCLDWTNPRSFFESERGSFTIQMWWSYTQGTRDDLANTVPPKIAQRIFTGMLNESLTILCVRYLQVLPSAQRSDLLLTDISNLLLCVSNLLTFVCDNSNELLGTDFQGSHEKILRDIHVKCNELFICFLVKGTPLHVLYKLFKNGIETFKSGGKRCINSWLHVALPDLLASNSDLDYIATEVKILLGQPQANWSLLVKILSLNDFHLAKTILELTLLPSLNTPYQKQRVTSGDCEKFLCPNNGMCQYVLKPENINNDVTEALVFIILTIAHPTDIRNTLVNLLELSGTKWAAVLDRREVWCVTKPSWLNALCAIIAKHLEVVADLFLNDAIDDDAIKVVLECFTDLLDCLPANVVVATYLLAEILPANVYPMGGSVLLQIMVSTLYREFWYRLETNRDGTSEKIDLINSLMEALCNIDVAKYSREITRFIDACQNDMDKGRKSTVMSNMKIEFMTNDVLLTHDGRLMLKVVYLFLKFNENMVLKRLKNVRNDDEQFHVTIVDVPFLFKAFHIGDVAFDRFLTKKWQPDWQRLLLATLSYEDDRFWYNLRKRWEFVDENYVLLNEHDRAVVDHVKPLFKKA